MPSPTFEELGKSVQQFVERRNWTKYHWPKDIAVALMIEAAELLEIFQWRPDTERLTEDEMEKVKMEVADVVIYALSMSNACGFDLGEAVAAKIAKNDAKYPPESSENLFG